jgi:alanyl-tRNA synthetase
VDTGMGLERMLTVLQHKQSVYECDLFQPWTTAVEDLWRLDGWSTRVVCDHLRSSVVVMGDGVLPSNTGRGYVLRRLMRRLLTILWRGDPTRTLSDLPLDPVRHTLEHFGQKPRGVLDLLVDEERRFDALLRRGRPLVSRHRSRGPLSDDDYSYLHETHGLPRDLVDGLLSEEVVR